MNELKYLYAFAHAGSEVVMFRPHPMVTSRSRTQRAEIRKAAFRSHFEGACIKTYRLDEFGVERLLLNNGIVADLDILQAIDPAIMHAETLGDEALVVCSGRLDSRARSPIICMWILSMRSGHLISVAH